MLGTSLRMALHRTVASAGRHAVPTSLRHRIVGDSVALAAFGKGAGATANNITTRAFSLCSVTASRVAQFGGSSFRNTTAVPPGKLLRFRQPLAPPGVRSRLYNSTSQARSGGFTADGTQGLPKPRQGFFSKLFKSERSSKGKEGKGASRSEVDQLRQLNRNNEPEAVLEMVSRRQVDTRNFDVAVEYVNALSRLGRLDQTSLAPILRQHGKTARDQLIGAGAADGEPLLVRIASPTFGHTLMKLVPPLIILGCIFFYLNLSGADKDGATRGLSNILPGLGDDVGKQARSNMTFDDVKGAPEAKQDLVEVVEFLKNPEKFTSLGGKLPKGILLVGPPGTGKTLLAKAVAGEAGVPFFYASGSEFEEVFVGLGAKRVRELFDKAKKNSPCIVFIDEIDAVGSKRTAIAGNSNRQTINQLLSELDGFEEDEEAQIVVIAATNFAQVLDKALTRPGRFDRHVHVTLPDVASRTEILELYLDKCPVDETVDARIIARGTPGVSGADLANVVNMAAIQASVEGKTTISQSHLEWAKDKMLMGPERKSAVMRKEDLKCTAYHETGHALVAMLTPGSMPIHKATIMPRGQALGMVSQLPEHDVVSMSKKQIHAKLDVLMGGRVAEEVFFGEDEVTTGASSDMQQATMLARRMVTQYGFTEAGGLMFTPDDDVRNMSPEHRAMIDREVKKILDSAYRRAKNLITTNKDKMHSVAKALLQHETLSGDQLKDIVRTGHL